MPPRIIGLTGHIGVGKSEVAQWLELMCGFERFKFAYKLKAMLKVLGLTMQEVEGDLKEQPCALLGGRTPRYAMITLGTEWGREYVDEDLWVRSSMLDVEASRSPRIVFDDVRFPNEALAIKERGGEIWRIVRKVSGDWEAHKSEAGQRRIQADKEIYNDGTFEELFDDINELIRTRT